MVVPKGASSNYKKADYWKDFNIIEYDSVDDVADGAVVVAADGRMLMVAGADGQRIDVFSADGRQVYSGTDSSAGIAAGWCLRGSHRSGGEENRRKVSCIKLT